MERRTPRPLNRLDLLNGPQNLEPQFKIGPDGLSPDQQRACIGLFRAGWSPADLSAFYDVPLAIMRKIVKGVRPLDRLPYGGEQL